MKKRKSDLTITQLVGIFYAVFFIIMLDFAEGKKINNTPDRQVTFQKILEIKETNDSFYFKYPYRVYADNEENVYVLDSGRLLKFSKTGSFIKNLINKGQGPGEIISISNIQVDEDCIIVHNNNPSKIIRLNKEGKLEKEIRLEKNDRVEFSHYYENKYYFFYHSIPEGNTSETYIDENYTFFRVSADGKKQESLYNFPLKKYIIRNSGAIGTFDIADLITAVYDGRYLFLYHTPKYKIKRIDGKENKNIHEFGIEYKRQEISEKMFMDLNPGMIILNGKRYKKPAQKYLNDIRNLLVYKNVLWVVTSMVDIEKGTRVDVYNFSGKNTDRFYVLLPDHPDLYSVNWCISGDYLYSLDTPDGQDPKVIKYRINLK